MSLLDAMDFSVATVATVVMRVFDRGLAGASARRFGFRNVQPTETFMVGALAVEEGSRLAGTAMHELSASTRVIAGDRAYLVGPYEELLGVLDRARVQVG